MSFKLNISDKDRTVGRFISKVKKQLFLAALAEKKESGVSQQSIADKLGVNRSVINRLLRGSGNLTLRSVAEIAWALEWEIVFELRKRPMFVSNAATADRMDMSRAESVPIRFGSPPKSQAAVD